MLGYLSVSPKPPSPTDTVLRQRLLLKFRLPKTGAPSWGHEHRGSNRWETWRSVYQNSRAGSSIGFGRDPNDEKVGMDAIMASNIVSRELLNRFNNDPVFLEYPSLEETRCLLRASGITRLAKQLGVEVEAESIDWAHGGMRALETVATRLVLAYHRQHPASLAKLPDPQAGQAAGQLTGAA